MQRSVPSIPLLSQIWMAVYKLADDSYCSQGTQHYGKYVILNHLLLQLG